VIRSLIVIGAVLAAVPAQAFDTQRPDVQAFIADLSKRHGFKRTELRALLRNAQSKPAIIEAITRPAEQTLPWFEYRDRFLTEQRIAKGMEFWDRQTEQLQRAANATGVAPQAIVGILGVETRFGEITGSFRVLDALATLGFDYPPRGDFFRSELAEFLLLAREEKVDARKALGSYAGAIGAPQFMPSNYRKLAMDGDGNGRRDLWKSWPDTLLSIGNYLRSHGWRNGEPIAVSATVSDADLPKFNVSRLRLNETVASLREKGARFETDLPPEAPAMLLVVEGRDGNEYRVGFTNFNAIARYNPRVKYVLAVHDLGVAVERARADAQTDAQIVAQSVIKSANAEP
jgi:membrane-bound lytic murein transglycosylase B